MLVGRAVKGELGDQSAAGGNLLEQLRVLWRGDQVDASAENADGAALAAQRALVGGGVNTARATTDDGDAEVGELIGQFAGGFDTVMGGHPRADHGDGVLVLGAQLAFDVEDNGRVVDLAQ